MKKNSANTKSFIMMWIIVIIVMALLVMSGEKILGNTLMPAAAIVCLVLSLPIAYLLLIITYKLFIKRPVSITYMELYDELTKNGLSEKSIELVDRGLAEIGSKPGNIIYLNFFAVTGCEYYIYKKDNEKALSYINLVDIIKIKGGELSFVDGGISVSQFFVAQMELSEAMNDKVRANNVIADCKQILDKNYGKTDQGNLLIDTVWFLYHYVLQDYQHAMQHAERILNNKLHTEGKLITGFICCAKVCIKTGDEERARALVAEAERISKANGKAIDFQNLEMFYREFPGFLPSVSDGQI